MDDKAIGIGAITLLGMTYIIACVSGVQVPQGVVSTIIAAIAGLVTGRAVGSK